MLDRFEAPAVRRAVPDARHRPLAAMPPIIRSMRRLLLIVLVALLPLQWSGAAAAVRCLHGDVQRAHGDRADAVPADGLEHHHAGHRHHPARGGEGHRGHAGPADDAHATHAGPAGHSDAVAAGDAPSSDPDAMSVDGALPAGHGDCGHGDCGECCHGTGTAPPLARPLPSLPAFAVVPARRADASPASPPLDGLFRPPRTASA